MSRWTGQSTKYYAPQNQCVVVAPWQKSSPKYETRWEKIIAAKSNESMKERCAKHFATGDFLPRTEFCIAIQCRPEVVRTGF